MARPDGAMEVRRAAQAVADALTVMHLPGWLRVGVGFRAFGDRVAVEVTEVVPRPGARSPVVWTGRDEDVQRRHLGAGAARLRAALQADGVAWDGAALALSWPEDGDLVLEVGRVARIPLAAGDALVDAAVAQALAEAFVARGPAAAPPAGTEYDPSRGAIVSSDGARVPAQFVGSFAPEDGTWLWGWGNPHAGGDPCTGAVRWICQNESGAIFRRQMFGADLALSEHLACLIAQRLGGRPLVGRSAGFSFYVA